MKISFSFLIVCLACLACNDAVDLTSINKDLDNRNATESSQGIIVPAPAYQWYRLPDTGMEAPDSYDFEGKIFKCNGKAYALKGAHVTNTYRFNETTNTWDPNPVNLHQFVSSYSILFSNGLYLYGLSEDGQNRVAAINVNTGNFISRSAFPGVFVNNFAAVTVGSNGYLLGGYHDATTISHFWKYDFVRDQWTNLGDLPGGHRAGASAFVVEDKIYFGLGFKSEKINNTTVRTYKKDWLVIDPNNNSDYYISRANFPGEPRQLASGFVINNKVYLGWGYDASQNNSKDFWEFSPSINKWTEKPPPDELKNIRTFSLGDTGYAVKFGHSGYSDDAFWRYSNSPLVLK